MHNTRAYRSEGNIGIHKLKGKIFFLGKQLKITGEVL